MRTRNPKRVVVVTGASAGVGRATVRAFAGEGAYIGLIARDTEGLHVAAREVVELGGKGLAAAADVADADQVEEAAARIENELGPIEVWVNNAMTTVFARVIDVTPAEFKRATEVTYLGTVYGTMSALRRMLPRNAGRIIQVGSALAYRSIPLQAAYCGANMPLRVSRIRFRTELIHDGKNIHLTMVQLPAMNTPQFTWCRTKMHRHPQPVPPVFRPEVAAERIVWASHHRRREVFVGAPTVIAIEGNKSLRRWRTIIWAARALIRSRPRNPSRRIGRTIYSSPCRATSAPRACSGSRRMKKPRPHGWRSTKARPHWPVRHWAFWLSQSRSEHLKERNS